MATKEEIIEAISSMTVLELSELVKEIEEKFDVKEFQTGFTSFAFQLRSDGLIILFMIPLMVGLFIVSKKGVKHGESMMVFIAGMLLITPIITGFTSQTNQPYRFVPLVVFFAIALHMMIMQFVYGFSLNEYSIIKQMALFINPFAWMMFTDYKGSDLHLSLLVIEQTVLLIFTMWVGLRKWQRST